MALKQYKKVIIKLSGESLGGKQRFGLNTSSLDYIAAEIYSIFKLNVKIGIVVGGGNFLRGAKVSDNNINRTTADYMGMLATIINGLALQSALEKKGVRTRVQSALSIKEVCEPFIWRRALRHLSKGRLVIFSAGTGNPYFSTDTAAALRASELKADIILKATKVDGVYDDDPTINKSAKFLEKLSFKEVIDNEYKVMDQTAVTICKENNIPIMVFNIFEKGNLLKTIKGERTGTLIF